MIKKKVYSMHMKFQSLKQNLEKSSYFEKKNKKCIRSIRIMNVYTFALHWKHCEEREDRGNEEGHATKPFQDLCGDNCHISARNDVPKKIIMYPMYTYNGYIILVVISGEIMGTEIMGILFQFQRNWRGTCDEKCHQV